MFGKTKGAGNLVLSTWSRGITEVSTIFTLNIKLPRRVEK